MMAEPQSDQVALEDPEALVLEPPEAVLREDLQRKLSERESLK